MAVIRGPVFLARVAIGGSPDSALNAPAILGLTSTTHAFKVPTMSTTQRDAIANPVNGLIIYNGTTATVQRYIGGWADI